MNYKEITADEHQKLLENKKIFLITPLKIQIS